MSSPITPISHPPLPLYDPSITESTCCEPSLAISEVSGPTATTPTLARKTLTSFSIQEFNGQERALLIKTAIEWSNLVDEKCESVSESTDITILEESKEICELIQTDLDEDNTAGLACLDKDGKIQAMASYSKKNNYVSCLITHPNNLTHPINKDIPSKVRNAASTIILHLAFQTQLLSKSSLKLCAYPSAHRFYEKLQFEHVAPTSWTMELTCEKITRLTMSKTPPFDKTNLKHYT